MTEATAAAVTADTTNTAQTNTGAAPQGGSILSGVTETVTTQAAEPAQTETNWRDSFAGGDADFRKRLDRFTDATAFARSYREMERKMSSGELKAAPQPFPEKGSAEEQAAWRKEQGIPADAKEYKIELPNGMVLGESDKPGVERLTAFAHKNNWTPAQLNGVMAAYYNEVDAARAAREQRDAEFLDASEAALRDTWKGDYRRNTQAIRNMLDTAPKDVREAIEGGRGADGNRLINNPSVAQWLAQMAFNEDPSRGATMLPVGSQNMQGVGNRVDELRKMISDSRSDYWQGPNAEKLQKEYRDLLDVQERGKSRAA